MPQLVINYIKYSHSHVRSHSAWPHCSSTLTRTLDIAESGIVGDLHRPHLLLLHGSGQLVQVNCYRITQFFGNENTPASYMLSGMVLRQAADGVDSYTGTVNYDPFLFRYSSA